MNNPEYFDTPPHEQEPAERLVMYLRGQCSDAIAKQRAELDRGDTSMHGSFIRRVSFSSEQLLLQRTACFLMKPPHPLDTSGVLARVYAVMPPDYSPADFYDLDTNQIAHFFVQKQFEDVLSSLWLVDETGVTSTEISANTEQLSVGVRNQPEDLASQLLEELSGYNIVADSEKL